LNHDADLLLRGSKLTLNTDLGKIATENAARNAGLFPERPALLERHAQSRRRAAWKTGGFPLKVYTKAKGAWVRRQEGQIARRDGSGSGWRNRLVFPTIRKKDDRR